MNKTICNRMFKKIIWGSIIYSLAAASIFAANEKDSVKTNFGSRKAANIVAESLTKKLKSDLIQENIILNLENLEQTTVSNGEIKLQGRATCVLAVEKTSLPLTFEAKINLARESVEDITYTFVESEYAPTSEEEVLMKELMQKISRDYKTEEIVIAIENFAAAASAGDKVLYRGVGEVRIGAFHWSKINFDVTLNGDKSAARVAYQIK